MQVGARRCGSAAAQPSGIKLGVGQAQVMVRDWSCIDETSLATVPNDKSSSMRRDSQQLNA